MVQHELFSEDKRSCYLTESHPQRQDLPNPQISGEKPTYNNYVMKKLKQKPLNKVEKKKQCEKKTKIYTEI